MQKLTIPYSGRLLVSQMAAFGLLNVLDVYGFSAYLHHDPHSLEMTPIVEADIDLDALAELIRRSARECERTIEADVIPGQTGNGRTPVIRARATSLVRADEALSVREILLEALEVEDNALALALVSGLGAPGVWLRDGSKPVPGRGATALDGVPYNIGSDIVRGALRHTRQWGEQVERTELEPLLSETSHISTEEGDKHRWTPPGVEIAGWCQWLAGLGLALLPIGLAATSAARTPGYLRRAGQRHLTLPVFANPVSRPKLRALLQLRDLADPDPIRGASVRLRAMGLSELIRFPVIDSSNGSMVSFAFDVGERIQL